MPKSTKPTIVGRGLAGELRALREASKLSVRAVASQLDWQASKLSRMETGQQGIRVEDVASLLVIYRVTGNERKRLLGMAERSDEPNWWEVLGGISAESRTLIQLEAEAIAIFDYEPLLVPGLLQTADYTRALMKSGGVPDVDAQARVAARLGRQAILTKNEPPDLNIIIDEGVLHRTLSTSAMHARQLRHLLEMAARPSITLRVIPRSVGAHNGLDGSFVLLDFPRNRSVAYFDHKISGLFLEDPDQVTFLRREADALTGVALSPTDSLELVAQVATQRERE
jgi:transcriptional regulator with XRE-family HTH domain